MAFVFFLAFLVATSSSARLKRVSQQIRGAMAMRTSVNSTGPEGGCLCGSSTLKNWVDNKAARLERNKLAGVTGHVLTELSKDISDNSNESVMMKYVGAKLVGGLVKETLKIAVPAAVTGSFGAGSAGAAFAAAGVSFGATQLLLLPLTVGAIYVTGTVGSIRSEIDWGKDRPMQSYFCSQSFFNLFKTIANNLLGMFNDDVSAITDLFHETRMCAWRPTSAILPFTDDWKYGAKATPDFWGFVTNSMISAWNNGGKRPDSWWHKLFADPANPVVYTGLLSTYAFAHRWPCKREGKGISDSEVQAYIERFVYFQSCMLHEWSERKGGVTPVASAIASTLESRGQGETFVQQVMQRSKEMKVDKELLSSLDRSSLTNFVKSLITQI